MIVHSYANFNLRCSPPWRAKRLCCVGRFKRSGMQDQSRMPHVSRVITAFKTTDSSQTAQKQRIVRSDQAVTPGSAATKMRTPKVQQPATSNIMPVPPRWRSLISGRPKQQVESAAAKEGAVKARSSRSRRSAAAISTAVRAKPSQPSPATGLSKAAKETQSPPQRAAAANSVLTKPAVPSANGSQQQDGLADMPGSLRPAAEAAQLDNTLERLWKQYWQPAGLIFASAHVLATACAVSGIAASPPWLPPIVGASVGSLFAALNRYGVVRFWRAPVAPLRVVITGSTKGIGKALAREFLRAGDEVMVTARSMHGVRNTVTELRAELGPGVAVSGVDVDVSSPASIARLARAAQAQLGAVDIWINNAGYSGSFQSLLDARPEQIVEVVQTNLQGTLLATREALLLMAQQDTAGHVFNVDGAGADGQPTPQYAAYGATKSGISHVMGSVKQELQESGSLASVHTISPGMVLTGLLLSGATMQNKRVFNILCEQPETIAAYLVPRMRTVVARGGQSHYIKYLTPMRALWFFLNAPFRASRFFDKEGQRLYLDEQDRMYGRQARRTARLAAAAARRTHTLGLVYSLSMSASFLLIALFEQGRM